jgi:hypothetical protein
VDNSDKAVTPSPGTSPENPDNIVKLTDTIMDSAASKDLEQRRKIQLRALEIASKVLENDAARLEMMAKADEMTLQKFHQAVEQARSLRTAVGWIQTMYFAPMPEENLPTMDNKN